MYLSKFVKKEQRDLTQNPWHDKTRQCLINVQYLHTYKAIDKIIHNFQLFNSKSWHDLINIARVVQRSHSGIN